MITIIYSVLFISFIQFYYNDYKILSNDHFQPDLKQSLKIAEEYHTKTGLKIYVLGQESIYPKILFYNLIPNNEFRATVKWKNFSSAFQDVNSFGHYNFMQQIDYINTLPKGIYLLPVNKKNYFRGFKIQNEGDFTIAVPEGW